MKKTDYQVTAHTRSLKIKNDGTIDKSHLGAITASSLEELYTKLYPKEHTSDCNIFAWQADSNFIGSTIPEPFSGVDTDDFTYIFNYTIDPLGTTNNIYFKYCLNNPTYYPPQRIYEELQIVSASGVYIIVSNPFQYNNEVIEKTYSRVLPKTYPINLYFKLKAAETNKVLKQCLVTINEDKRTEIIDDDLHSLNTLNARSKNDIASDFLCNIGYWPTKTDYQSDDVALYTDVLTIPLKVEVGDEINWRKYKVFSDGTVSAWTFDAEKITDARAKINKLLDTNKIVLWQAQANDNHMAQKYTETGSYPRDPGGPINYDSGEAYWKNMFIQPNIYQYVNLRLPAQLGISYGADINTRSALNTLSLVDLYIVPALYLTNIVNYRIENPYPEYFLNANWEYTQQQMFNTFYYNLGNSFSDYFITTTSKINTINNATWARFNGALSNQIPFHSNNEPENKLTKSEIMQGSTVAKLRAHLGEYWSTAKFSQTETGGEPITKGVGWWRRLPGSIEINLNTYNWLPIGISTTKDDTGKYMTIYNNNKIGVSIYYTPKSISSNNPRDWQTVDSSKPNYLKAYNKKILPYYSTDSIVRLPWEDGDGSYLGVMFFVTMQNNAGQPVYKAFYSYAIKNKIDDPKRGYAEELMPINYQYAPVCITEKDGKNIRIRNGELSTSAPLKLYYSPKGIKNKYIREWQTTDSSAANYLEEYTGDWLHADYTDLQLTSTSDYVGLAVVETIRNSFGDTFEIWYTTIIKNGNKSRAKSTWNTLPSGGDEYYYYDNWIENESEWHDQKMIKKVS